MDYRRLGIGVAALATACGTTGDPTPVAVGDPFFVDAGTDADLDGGTPVVIDSGPPHVVDPVIPPFRCVSSPGSASQGGAAWQPTDANSAALTASPGRINSVWASGPHDVWAVGYQGTVAHWDGRAWRLVLTRSTAAFNQVWGNGPGDLRVASYGRVFHWDGHLWGIDAATGVPMMTAPTWHTGLQEGWGIDPSGQPLRWDGRGWIDVGRSGPGYATALWGLSSCDVWAVGDRAAHWNGTAWTTVPPPPLDPGRRFDEGSVWGSAANDVWIAGTYWFDPGCNNSTYGGALLHWNGAALTVALTAGGMGDPGFDRVHGSGADDVWTSAANQTWHWDGHTWRQQNPAGTQGVHGIWVNGRQDAWGIGSQDSSVMHWDGARWTVSLPGPTLTM